MSDGYFPTTNIDLASYLITRGHELKRTLYTRGAMSFWFDKDRVMDDVNSYTNKEETRLDLHKFCAVRRDLYARIRDEK